MNNYVYVHRDPDTGEILYVGLGTRARALDPNKRGAEHRAWMEAMWESGINPMRWLSFPGVSLSRKDAASLEMLLIRSEKPRFNMVGLGFAAAGHGEDNHNAKLTAEAVAEMRQLWSAGSHSLRALGRQFGVSYSTARGAVLGLRWKAAA